MRQRLIQLFAKEESLTPLGPGQLASHYAPSKKLFIGNLNQLVLAHAQEKIATISLSTRFEHIPDNLQFTLSPKGDLNEAAHNIFSALREADKLDVACILAEWMPEEGLGRAINDRLKRASA